MKKGLQSFYYNSVIGFLLGSKVREKIIDSFVSELKKSNSMLDVGCAEGYYLNKFKDKFHKIIGLEFNENRILKAKQYTLNKFMLVRASAESLPFKDNSFDLVLCSEVLEHVPDWKKALSELQRITGKYIILTIPLEKSLIWRMFSFFSPMSNRGHLHKLDSKELFSELKNKFVLKEIKRIYFPFSFLNNFVSDFSNEKLAMYSCILLEKI